MLNRVESTDYSRATTVVHTHEYPITLHMVGIGQMSRPNARCLPIVLLSKLLFYFLIGYIGIVLSKASTSQKKT